MRKLKFMFIIALFALLIGILVACGDNESSGESSSDDDDVITLTMTAWGSPEEFQVYQRGIDAYMELHPNVRIELIEAPGDGYENRLLTQLQGSTAPDLFYVGDGYMSRLAVNESVLDLSEYLEGSDSYVKEDEFSDGTWGAARQDGKVFGLPVDVNPLVIYYNKGMFEELGIKLPQEYFDEGNWNWDAFREVTGQLRDAGMHGFIQESWWAQVYNWVWANGGRLYDEDMNYIGHEDPKTQEAFEFISQNIQDGYTSFAGSFPEGQGSDAMFMSNQVGMASAGRWWVPGFRQVDGLDFDIVPVPTNTGNPIEPVGIGAAYLSVNVDTEFPEKAMHFASFYTSEQGQEIRLGDTGNAVPSVSGIDHVVTNDPIPAHSQHLVDLREIGYANGHVEILDARVPGLGTEFEEQIELMFLGDQDYQTTLNNIAEIANQMIDEHLR